MARRASEVLSKCLRCSNILDICNCFNADSSSNDGSTTSHHSNTSQQALEPTPTVPPLPTLVPAHSPSLISTMSSLNLASPRRSSSQEQSQDSSSNDEDGLREEILSVFSAALSGVASDEDTPGWMKADDGMFEDDPTLSHFKYNKFQAAGIQRQKWIENADEPDCPVASSSLTFADLQRDYQFPEPEPENLDIVLKDQVKELGLPNEFDNSVEQSAYWEFDFMSTSHGFYWSGSTGPGVIVLSALYRRPDSDGPRIAIVSKAVYEYKFPIESLKHVLVTSIINRNTDRFLKEKLYVEANDLSWPRANAFTGNFPPLTWEIGSDEYYGLLGTQFGKIISALVLRAYPRGTRRIARIVTWPLPVCMRFDIEEAS